MLVTFQFHRKEGDAYYPEILSIEINDSPYEICKGFWVSSEFKEATAFNDEPIRWFIPPSQILLIEKIRS